MKSIKWIFIVIISWTLLSCDSEQINSVTSPNASPEEVVEGESRQGERGNSKPKEKPSAGTHKNKYKDGQVYYIHVPELYSYTSSSEVSLLVIVHGFTGQANGRKGQKVTLKNMKRWIPFAEDNNCILLAPHFSEKIFDRDYQRLNLEGDVRADHRLNDLIEELKSTFPNLKDDKIKMFGFSGGAQFVHRYSAFHPKRVDKAVIGGAGWYMWPDPLVEYPVGTNLDKVEKVKQFDIDIEGMVQNKICVMIGKEDKKQGSFREEYHELDMGFYQGEDRLERAINWINALNIYADRAGVECHVTLRVIPDAGHEITKEFLHAAANYLF